MEIIEPSPKSDLEIVQDRLVAAEGALDTIWYLLEHGTDEDGTLLEHIEEKVRAFRYGRSFW